MDDDKIHFPAARSRDQLDEMREYVVDVKADGRVWTVKVDATDDEEAIERAARRCGIEITVRSGSVERETGDA